MKTYKIQQGDSLFTIAKKFYNDGEKYRVLADYNGIKNLNKIEIGQVIKIPDLDALEQEQAEWNHYGDGTIWWRLTNKGVEIKGEGIVKDDKATKRVADIWKNYGTLVTASAEKYGVPIPAILATISTESAGKPKAYRYEPLFYTRYIKNQAEWKASPYYKFPRRIAASYGLVQIMYTTAYTVGFRGKPEDLYDPASNIDAGAAYIASQYQVKNHHWDPPKIACAYNAGSIRATRGNPWGMYHYPGHLDRWIPSYNAAVELTGTTPTAPETPQPPQAPAQPAAPKPAAPLPTTSPKFQQTSATLRFLFSVDQEKAWKPRIVDIFKHRGAEIDDPVSFTIAAVKPQPDGCSYDLPNIALGVYDVVFSDAKSGAVLEDIAEIEVKSSPTLIDLRKPQKSSREIAAPDTRRATVRMRFAKTPGRFWKPLLVDFLPVDSEAVEHDVELMTVSIPIAPLEKEGRYAHDIPNVPFGQYDIGVTDAENFMLLREIAGFEVNQDEMTILVDAFDGNGDNAAQDLEIPENFWERVKLCWSILWQ